MTDNVYTVFRRSDGPAGIIATEKKSDSAHRLRPYGAVSYTILLQTTDWDEAYDLLNSLRRDSP